MGRDMLRELRNAFTPPKDVWDGPMYWAEQRTEEGWTAVTLSTARICLECPTGPWRWKRTTRGGARQGPWSGTTHPWQAVRPSTNHPGYFFHPAEQKCLTGHCLLTYSPEKPRWRTENRWRQQDRNCIGDVEAHALQQSYPVYVWPMGNPQKRKKKEQKWRKIEGYKSDY